MSARVALRNVIQRIDRFRRDHREAVKGESRQRESVQGEHQRAERESEKEEESKGLRKGTGHGHTESQTNKHIPCVATLVMYWCSFPSSDFKIACISSCMREGPKKFIVTVDDLQAHVI